MWHRALVVEARQVFVLEEPINNVALSTVISFHLVVEQEVAAECIRNLSYLFRDLYGASRHPWKGMQAFRNLYLTHPSMSILTCCMTL